MRCIFIYNPKSGKGKILSKIEMIRSTLETNFSEVVLYATKSAEDTIEASKDACGKFDVLIFSGGDGTFNDVACGVASQATRPILGYIPSGTVNDIAKNLKIPKNIKKALKIIIDGERVFHDVGRINDSYFIYVAGVGTFTRVSYTTKQTSKKFFGKVAYGFAGVKEFFRPKLFRFKLTIDDKQHIFDSPLILIMNSTSVAGISFNKGGHLNDGKFDIVIVKRGFYKGIFNIFKLFILGLFGRRVERVTNHYRASNILVEVDNNSCWTVDGEKGPCGNVKIENLHNHLEIYVPKDKNKKTKSKSFN